MSRILNRSLADSGYLSPVMDSLNDMIQHCDYEGLLDELFQLCSSVVHQLDEVILSQSNPGGYAPAEKEIMVNNIGGLLQILIVRLQGRLERDGLRDRVLTSLQEICQ